MSWLVHLCGVVGNSCFGFACVSLARETLKKGDASVDFPTAVLFQIANIAFYTYLIGTYGLDLFYAPLGCVEIVSWAIVLFVKTRNALHVTPRMLADEKVHAPMSGGGGHGFDVVSDQPACEDFACR